MSKSVSSLAFALSLWASSGVTACAPHNTVSHDNAVASADASRPALSPGKMDLDAAANPPADSGYKGVRTGAIQYDDGVVDSCGIYKDGLDRVVVATLGEQKGVTPRVFVSIAIGGVVNVRILKVPNGLPEPMDLGKIAENGFTEDVPTPTTVTPNAIALEIDGQFRGVKVLHMDAKRAAEDQKAKPLDYPIIRAQFASDFARAEMACAKTTPDATISVDAFKQTALIYFGGATELFSPPEPVGKQQPRQQLQGHVA